MIPNKHIMRQALRMGKMKPEHSWRFTVPVLFVLLIIGLVFFDPTAFRFLPRCPFFALTGLKCPGCGSLRALHSLLHGNFVGAWNFNAAALLVLPFVAAGLIHNAFRGREPAFLFRHTWLGWSLAGGMILWWVLRNLLGW
jgi:hypothetical protein